MLSVRSSGLSVSSRVGEVRRPSRPTAASAALPARRLFPARRPASARPLRSPVAVTAAAGDAGPSGAIVPDTEVSITKVRGGAL